MESVGRMQFTLSEAADVEPNLVQDPQILDLRTVLLVKEASLGFSTADGIAGDALHGLSRPSESDQRTL